MENSDVDEGVSELLLASGGSIYYMKENEDGKEILFCNGQQGDEDVEEFSLYHVPDSSSVIYAVDYNEEKERGILKIYNGEEAQTIAEDVHMYQVISPDEIVVLADYSAKYEDGDLKLYSKDGDVYKRQLLYSSSGARHRSQISPEDCEGQEVFKTGF